jgi:hypothetical protein
MSGWTVVDSGTNKSLPIQGTGGSGVAVPYIAPSPASQDPVGKMRVSTPQSLIDTDFEYGTQPTKWESISLQNNRQSCYYNQSAPLAVSAITGTATADQVTITCAAITIAANTPIYIQNSTNSTINQWGMIITGGTLLTSYTVVFAPGSTTTTNAAAYYSATTTYVYLGTFFSNCGIQVGANCVTVTSATVLTVATSGAHGLSKGSFVYITGLGGTTTGQLGAFVVATVPTASSFTVTAVGAAGPSTNSAGNLTVYARPSGYVEPRAFDGGVAFSAGSQVPDQALIRQTRRYFRYQSGKGIQFSTGSSLQPPLFTTSLVSSSGTVTVTTRYNHNLVVGTTIQVNGVNQGGFNGTYTIATVPSPTTFTYAAGSSGSTTATGIAIKVTPTKWYGSSSRLGFFDNQNGMFFEYDGQTLYTVWRNSVQQINGTVAVTQGSATVTGTGTAFLSQVQPGQFIVIRGQSYRIVNITSDTVLAISPEYRGQTISGAIVSMTIDTRTPQSKWSDPCDGTGASGYTLDLTRMQMWYIDYSWYGAGFVRWGLRTTTGQIVYVNQQTNNNKRFEAYLRSGNMSAHYEVSGLAPTTYPVQALAASGTTTSADILITSTVIPVADTSKFNSGGGVAKLGAGAELVYYGGLSTTTGAGNLTDCVRGFAGTKADDQASGAAIDPSSIQVADTTGFLNPAAGSTATIKVSNALANEYITYSGITNTGLIYGLTRGQTGGAAATAFAAGTVTGVQYAAPDAVPSLSHWGSSAIMDGLFNDDKSLLFNYGVPAKLQTSVSTTQVCPVLAIRLAPSVDNGQTGILGNKEIINRMQLQLVELGIYATGPLLVQLILNGFTATNTFSGAFQPPKTQGVGASTSSLAQIAANTLNSVTLEGGESVAAAFTNTNGQTTLDLSGVRDLGNSILGGGNSVIVPTSFANVYPDGPDILYVCVTSLTGVATDVYARLTWKEAQA